MLIITECFLLINYLLEVFLDMLHRLSAEVLAEVQLSKVKNADTVCVVKMLFQVASARLKHCSHLQMHSTVT